MQASVPPIMKAYLLTTYTGKLLLCPGLNTSDAAETLPSKHASLGDVRTVIIEPCGVQYEQSRIRYM